MLVFESKETGESVVVNDDTATSPDMLKHEYEYRIYKYPCIND